MLESIRNRFTSDGPGFTDYPEHDIRTHRRIVRDLRILGFVLGFLFVSGGIMADNSTIVAVGAAVGFACFWAAADMDKQALE